MGSTDHSGAVRARRQRALLAMLLLHAGNSVPADRLVEAIWPARAPRDVRNQLQKSVLQLRGRLAGSGIDRNVIVTEPGGYRIAIDPGELDLDEFRRLVADARTANRAGRPGEANTAYRAALDLWRGPALADVDSPPVRLVATTLDDEHRQTLEECIELELTLGKSHEVLPQLTELARQHPYHENLHRLLMLALYRAGRHTDALQAYRDLRRLLHDELGIEPGSELRDLHKAVLNRDPGLTATQPTRPVPSTPPPQELPAAVADFTGRNALLQTLDGILAGRTEEATPPVVISAIAGTAGVGKTALAVYWAHRVAHRFPDGQLYLNLRGYASGPPLRPITALTSLLRSLGIRPEQIPADPEQAAALYRTQLAGRRVLIVLDNARSADQVRPLLPGSAGCLALVTSRDRLSGLVARDGARRLTLDVLTTAEADALLTHLLGTERLRAEPGAVADLARACAYLPLALRIAGAGLADSGMTVSEYLAELSSEDRLALLRVEEDEGNSVAAALDLSYRGLGPGPARMFRLLGLAPGPDFTVDAAAALAGTTMEEAGRHLTQLTGAHLVEERAPGRYTFHDLLRLYAGQLARSQDGDARCHRATERLARHYLQRADRAASLLYPHTVRLPVPPPDPALPAIEHTGPAQALAWLDGERDNLVAVIRHTAEHGPPAPGWLLADCLLDYLMRRQLVAEWRTVADAALASSRRAGDLQAQSAALLSSSKLHARTGHYREATEGFRTALDRAQRAGWTDGQAVLLRSLGIVHAGQGRLEEASESFSEALAIYERSGNLGGQASALTSLGLVNRDRGHLHDAAKHHSRALTIDQQLRSTDGLATCHTNLGTVHHDLGLLDQAAADLTHALELHRQAGDIPGEIIDLTRMAAVLRDTGHLSDALARVDAAMSLANDMDVGRLVADIQNTRGSILVLQDRVDEGLRQHRRALDLAGRLGARSPEISAHLGLAIGHHRLGDIRSAHEHAERAAESAGALGYQVPEGQAQTILAEIAIDEGRHGDARTHARQALESHRATGHRLGEAQVLTALAHLGEAMGEPHEAQRYRRAAGELFARIGAPVPRRRSGASAAIPATD